ncbi:MAG TPA: hypothetical protein VHO48_02640 [Anaerolineaceae bacterium]|nr:hypothetical protein [Anaerolineaceae bacterium]
MNWTASGNTSLPIARGMVPWDPETARTRIFRWAGFDKPQPSKRAVKAFLLVDIDHWTQPESYRYPIADVIDGELVIIPDAVEAATRQLSTERTGIELSETVLDHVWRKIQQINLKIEAQVGHSPQAILVGVPWGAAHFSVESRKTLEKAEKAV